MTDEIYVAERSGAGKLRTVEKADFRKLRCSLFQRGNHIEIVIM